MVTRIGTLYTAEVVGGPGAPPPGERGHCGCGDVPPAVEEYLLKAANAGGSSHINGLFLEDNGQLRCEMSFNRDGGGQIYHGIPTRMDVEGTVHRVTVFIPTDAPASKGSDLHLVEAMCIPDSCGERLEGESLSSFGRVFVLGEMFEDIESGSDSESEAGFSDEDEGESSSDESDVTEEEREPKRRRV
jgi:hypothetical protein